MARVKPNPDNDFALTEELWELSKFIEEMGGHEITPEQAVKEIRKSKDKRWANVSNDDIKELINKRNADSRKYNSETIRQIGILRASNKSPCGFLVTRDVKRVMDFEKNLRLTTKKDGEARYIITLNLFTGLKREGWRDAYDNEAIPPMEYGCGMSSNSQHIFEPAPVSVLTNAFAELSAWMAELAELKRNREEHPKRTWVVISGVAQFPDGRTNTDELIQFLNANLLDSTLFDMDVTVVVETETLEIFGENIVGNTWHYKPPVSTKFEREYVIKNALGKLSVYKAASEMTYEKFISIVENTAGINLNSTQSIITETILSLMDEPVEVLDIIDKKKELIDGIHGLKAPAESEIQGYGFDRMGGYEYLKTLVQENIVEVFKNRERAKRLKMSIPRGLLLFGPPGTGKTLFAKSLAKELEMMFIELNWGALKNKFVGASEERMRVALDTIDAMGERVILFIDEIDGIGGRGGDTTTGGVNDQLFTSVLSWLGDKKRKCLIIGTTNVPNQLDDAFIRAGRFDYKSYMGFPDETARAEIFKVHLDYGRNDEIFETDKSAAEKEAMFIKFAKATDYFVGSDIEAVCNEARKFAFKRIMKTGAKSDIILWGDVEDAINDRMVNIPERKKSEEKHQAMAARFTDSRQLYETFKHSTPEQEKGTPEQKKFTRLDEDDFF